MSGAPDPVRLLRTPEGIALRLHLAKLGDRAAAFMLDVMFIFIGLLVLVVLTLVLAGVLAGGARRVGGVLAGAGLGIVGMIWLVGLFLLRNFYFVLFELRPRGDTPGKRMLGLRVATRGGGRLGADAVLARNLVRELELFLPLTMLGVQGLGMQGTAVNWWLLLGLGWTGAFLLAPLLNRDRLRIGDLLAGTWVVQAPKPRLLADVLAGGVPGGLAGPHAPAPVFTTAQFAAYGITELHALEEVLQAQDAATMDAVASRIAAKTGCSCGAAATFLPAYYAGLRAHLERGLLLGREEQPGRG